MKVSPEVMAVLTAGRCEEDRFYLTGTLERKLYEATNGVLTALGAKWNRKAGAHVFQEPPRPAAEALEDVLLTGEAVNRRQELQFFETPPAVVAQLLEQADLCDGMAVLEPSAGKGAILRGIRALGVPGLRVTAVELDAWHAQCLREQCEELIPPGGTLSLEQGDFLRWEQGHAYNRVVMNPPFRKKQDLRHITHAYGQLAYGGRLVSVLSIAAQTNQDQLSVEFRELVDRRGGWFEIPEGAFSSSGTGARTCGVVLERD